MVFPSGSLRVSWDGAFSAHRLSNATRFFKFAIHCWGGHSLGFGNRPSLFVDLERLKSKRLHTRILAGCFSAIATLERSTVVHHSHRSKYQQPIRDAVCGLFCFCLNANRLDRLVLSKPWICHSLCLYPIRHIDCF